MKLIKLRQLWEIVRLLFVSVPPIFLVAVAKQVPGLGYMAAHLQHKNPFYFKKRTHLVRRSITRHIYPAVFGEKQEVSDQLPLRKVPSVYSTC